MLVLELTPEQWELVVLYFEKKYPHFQLREVIEADRKEWPRSHMCVWSRMIDVEFIEPEQ